MLVDLAHVDGLYTGMFDDFAKNTSIASADNEYFLWRSGGGEKRNVSDHLLIGELVTLRHLDTSIKHENLAIRGGLKHENVL